MTKLTTHKPARTKLTDPKSPSLKLTDSQLIVLSRAAQRQDGAATLPDGISDKPASKLAAALLEKGLVREVRSKSDTPVWRQGDEEDPRSLIITKLGRSTIEASDEGEAKRGENATMSPMKQTAPAPESKPASPRQGSKLAEVIALLSRKRGASIEELISATSWLPHTTRAALTGLRKRGYEIERERPEEGEASIYRIVQAPAQSSAS